MSAARSVKLQCPMCLREWTVEVKEIQPGLLDLPRLRCAGDGMAPAEVAVRPESGAQSTAGG